MAYGNTFPIGYQSYYPQHQNPYQVQAPSQQNSNLIWVSGEAGAKAYMIAPNTTVQLWDSEAQVIYLKSADASGMPSMKILDYTIRSETPTSHVQPVQTANPIEVSKSDLDALQSQIDALRDEVRAYRATVHEMKKEDSDGKSTV